MVQRCQGSIILNITNRKRVLVYKYRLYEIRPIQHDTQIAREMGIFKPAVKAYDIIAMLEIFNFQYFI
jgi:hypothetical protein